MNHGKYPGKQIAQIIGQIRIDALNQGSFTETGIQAKGHISNQKKAERIQTINIFKLQGFDHISETFGHLALFDIPVTVNIQMFVYRNAGRFKHDRPVDTMGFEDVFGHDVLGRRPECFKQLAIRISQGGDII